MRVEPAFYFGCWGETGHYWWDNNAAYGRRGVRQEMKEARVPGYFEHCDGRLQPGVRSWVHAGNREYETPAVQPQGPCALHYCQGWTAIAFWDRSVDTRGGSNSVFIKRGRYTFEEMRDSFAVRFPEVMTRLSFRLVLDPDEVHDFDQKALPAPLFCLKCCKRHVDEGEFATRLHHVHRCVDDAAGKGCGFEWRVEPYAVGVL